MPSRPQLALRRALWLALAALAAFGVTLVAAVTLIDRIREPEGSGLIVVQSLSSNVATTQHASADPTPASRPDPAKEERGALADPLTKKTAPAKARKPGTADPMQLMAASVADAFAKQKAGMIACLNEHAADIEGEPQLKVRLLIDRDGIASDAELLPAPVSSKPVAACVRTAVTRMSFPRLDQPATFNVPLLWRRK
jgi:hypothetical protein